MILVLNLLVSATVPRVVHLMYRDPSSLMKYESVCGAITSWFLVLCAYL